MPDITMCLNEKRKRRLECYRYIAKPDRYQSYSTFQEKDCDYYWPVDKEKNARVRNQLD